MRNRTRHVLKGCKCLWRNTCAPERGTRMAVLRKRARRNELSSRPGAAIFHRAAVALPGARSSVSFCIRARSEPKMRPPRTPFRAGSAEQSIRENRVKLQFARLRLETSSRVLDTANVRTLVLDCADFYAGGTVRKRFAYLPIALYSSRRLYLFVSFRIRIKNVSKSRSNRGGVVP